MGFRSCSAPRSHIHQRRFETVTPKTPHRGALVVGAITLLLVLTGCSSRPTAAPLETPPPDATPEQVVGSFIAAINAQDPSIVAAIATPGLAQSTVDGWFGTTIEKVQIDAALDGTQLAIGTDYEGQDNAWVHIDAVFHHTDGSLPEGELTGWGYYLTRDEPSSNWYIWTQGSS